MRLRIRELREARGLTQLAVAEELVCDQSLYSKYERGIRSLPLEAAVHLAEYYGVSLDYLAGRTDESAEIR
ncbi:MAG: helix-turn-helix transcriptional regulator [Solobacterium sp.]|nr:helix-turn-helix transcriptional regulator [Solobacterium sp.]